MESRKKISRERVLGYYQPAWPGQLPYVVLYIDRICRGLPAPLNHVSLLRDIVIGKVLFHEVGHHIHYTIRPEFKEREDVADEWAKKLLRDVIRQRHRSAVLLRPLFKMISFVSRLVTHRRE